MDEPRTTDYPHFGTQLTPATQSQEEVDGEEEVQFQEENHVATTSKNFDERLMGS